MRERKNIACTTGCVNIEGQEICDNPLYYIIKEKKKYIIRKKSMIIIE